MKKTTIYLSLLFCLAFIQSRSQTDLYTSVQINTIPTNYTVTAVNDTTFSREVVISIIDTLNFSSLTASLKVKTESGEWNALQTASLSEPNNSYEACTQTLCFYKRYPNVWVLFLGDYPLLSTHQIQLHFETQHPTTVNYDWSDEF